MADPPFKLEVVNGDQEVGKPTKADPTNTTGSVIPVKEQKGEDSQDGDKKRAAMQHSPPGKKKAKSKKEKKKEDFLIVDLTGLDTSEDEQVPWAAKCSGKSKK